jgi:hypothetical protein
VKGHLAAPFDCPLFILFRFIESIKNQSQNRIICGFVHVNGTKIMVILLNYLRVRLAIKDCSSSMKLMAKVLKIAGCSTLTTWPQFLTTCREEKR